MISIVYIATAQPSHENGLQVGAIVGIVIGSLIVILIVTIVTTLRWRNNCK